MSTPSASSASATSRSRSVAWTLRPAVSRWTDASRSRRWTGPCVASEALGLRERHPRGDAANAAGRGHDAVVGPSPGEIAIAKRALEERRGAAGRDRAAARPAGSGRAARPQSHGSRRGARHAAACAPASPSPLRRWRPATSTSRRHQPRRRQRNGSTSRTACTRPGRIVSEVSAMSPDRRRSPSADSASVKRYSWLKRRQTSVAAAMSRRDRRRPPPKPRRTARRRRRRSIRSGSPTDTKPTSLRRIDPTSRPVGTEVSTRSSCAVGARSASPAAASGSTAP